MKFILLFMLISGAWADVPSQRVGCDANPCQHQCVDTIDSYYCLCFENYIMQPDQHSCLHKNTEALEKASQGCWSDEEAARDLPYRIWTRPEDATVSECMHDCNARGFDFAGLQNGDECWCGNTYYRAYADDAVCDIACPGAPAQLCGGIMASSIYKVNRDERYMGCFNEDPSDPDLPTLLWPPEDGKSVDECITTCGVQGYNYSGVFNGGQCSCGNNFGRHGTPVNDLNCSIPCYDGYAGSNCGGNTTNAIYRVSRGTTLAELNARGAYRIEGNRATVNLDNLFLYPNYLGLYAKRFMVYASDTVNTIYDDATCTHGDCYALCGEIYTPPGFDRYREDVIIRRFHVSLSEVEALVAHPETALRVYVFAQTFYIDQSVDFPWSLYIRARQIIINYEAIPSITYDHTGPEFPDDINQAIFYGSKSDLAFQKLSLLCAQVLISSESEDYNRVGWNIIDDMARDRAYSEEQQHFLDSIRTLRASINSIGRNDIHWAPYYNKDYYTANLDKFYSEISEFNDVFEEMVDETIECDQFVSRAGTLLGIWADTVVTDAEIVKEFFKDNLEIALAVFEGVVVEFRESYAELFIAFDEFKAGIEAAITEVIIKSAMYALNVLMDVMFKGLFPAGAEVVADLIRLASELKVLIEHFGPIVENITKAIEQIRLFFSVKDKIVTSEDFERYIDNVEVVAGLENLLELWPQLKDSIDEIFLYDLFRHIDGAIGFSFAMYDILVWAESINRALIEVATNFGQYMSAFSWWRGKVKRAEALQEAFEKLQGNCDEMGAMTILFAELNYDLMLQLNQNLIQFCQAYYYEEMWDCPVEARPNFAFSVDELLTTINQAKLLSLFSARKSTAYIDIDIVDDPSAWANCSNSKVCPVKVFREDRTLTYQLALDHPRFEGLDLFMIEEMEVYLTGASTTNTYTDCRVQITSSGPFYNRKEDEVSTFLTRPLHYLLFQYDLQTESIELRANLYDTNDGTIKHMSPFTTWMITVPTSHDFIDLSQVTSVHMVFHGSTYN